MSLVQIRITSSDRLTGRVSTEDVLRLLHAEADRTGEDRLRVSASTLRGWKSRSGVPVSPGPGYDVAEVVAYLRTRGTRGQHRTIA
ncbi:hypothetical protein KCV87_32255 [Actinosynnema pretiosum subsp. pretiosum]|uniref:Uncharacterized protein n=1 Tax=Actinosynnema pretiosum subsp. pretiosum TaxID=103721 RepID=A0AA45R3L9_9PSEU|nr:hypothetical protein APASM_4688 [Actinosynnema pretiosum subsp. pretiosum]QUF03976.1 hypothetical protein KCV87_32255 [Actinosynnema pretiosum subsp. pretiosum]